MIGLFFSSVGVMFEAILKIFIIALAGGILVRKKIFKEEHLKGLSQFTIFILLPCLTFSNVVTTFKPDELTNWWILPLIGLVMSFVGLGIGALLFFRNLKSKKNFLPVAGLQNAGYLVLPIGKLVFPEQFDLFALYTFLFLIGFNPVLWSIGKYLCTSTDTSNYKFKFVSIITPPLVANIISVVLVLIGLHVYIPQLILQPIELMGTATVPVANFILGATLGNISLKYLPGFRDVLKVNFSKFILVPAITLLLILILKINETNKLLASFLIIQSSAAPAANILVMIQNYGGEVQKIGGLMLLSYLVSMIAMPFWVALMNMF
jgi:predicted permease